MRLKKIIEAADAVAVIHAGDTVASCECPRSLDSVVERRRIELPTSALRTRRSPS